MGVDAPVVNADGVALEEEGSDSSDEEETLGVAGAGGVTIVKAIGATRKYRPMFGRNNLRFLTEVYEVKICMRVAFQLKRERQRIDQKRKAANLGAGKSQDVTAAEEHFETAYDAGVYLARTKAIIEYATDIFGGSASVKMCTAHFIESIEGTVPQNARVEANKARRMKRNLRDNFDKFIWDQKQLQLALDAGSGAGAGMMGDDDGAPGSGPVHRADDAVSMAELTKVRH